MMKYCIIWMIAALPFSIVMAQDIKKDPVFSDKNGAIRGYDPLSYFSEGKPEKGDKTISLEWNSATWYFTTTAHRDSFAASPQKFAPQYGGYCAYGWAKGYPAPTQPNAWRIVDGKLYLNYDTGVQATWNKKYKDYIQTADKNWQKAE